MVQGMVPKEAFLFMSLSSVTSNLYNLLNKAATRSSSSTSSSSSTNAASTSSASSTGSSTDSSSSSESSQAYVLSSSLQEMQQAVDQLLESINSNSSDDENSVSTLLKNCLNAKYGITESDLTALLEKYSAAQTKSTDSSDTSSASSSASSGSSTGSTGSTLDITA